MKMAGARKMTPADDAAAGSHAGRSRARRAEDGGTRAGRVKTARTRTALVKTARTRTAREDGVDTGRTCACELRGDGPQETKKRADARSRIDPSATAEDWRITRRQQQAELWTRDGGPQRAGWRRVIDGHGAVPCLPIIVPRAGIRSKARSMGRQADPKARWPPGQARV